MPAFISPFSILKLMEPAGKVSVFGVFWGFVKGSSLALFFLIPLYLTLFLFFSYAKIYSKFFLILRDKFGGVADLNQLHCPAKLLSPNILWQSILSCATSWSSIEIKMTPSSASNSLANSNLLFIKFSHLLCL